MLRVDEYRSADVWTRHHALLLIEDDSLVYQVWRMICRRLESSIGDPMEGGIDLTWTTSAKNACIQLQQAREPLQPFDLVISDIYLADGETGLDLWRQFGHLVGAFVFTSAMPRERYVQLFTEFNMTAGAGEIPPFIPKPLDPVYAMETLKQILSKAHEEKPE